MNRPANEGQEPLDLGFPTPTPEKSVSIADFVGVERNASDVVPVSISLEIIERFSEGLYSSPNKTFEELVSNSYDAGAGRVWIYMPSDLTATNASIHVVDDGVAMDIEGLNDLWRIGKSRKRESPQSGTARAPIGKFGIGKLATYVLAEELTYLTLKDGVYRAVTMDYKKVQGGMSDPRSLDLLVYEITAEEAREAIASSLAGQDSSQELLDALFSTGQTALEHWTAAVMTKLKKPARSIQQGRLKWVLSTSIPLNPQFKLYYNGDAIQASKAKGTELWKFTIGADEPELPADQKIGKAETINVNDTPVPAYRLPEAGRVWGEAKLFEESLQKGHSNLLGRSHGYFVRIRQRLINLDDPTFNVGPELHHGTLTRFHMVINADDLDHLIASPRESLQDSPELRELRAYMLAVFNKARTVQKSADDRDPLPLLTKKGRIANPPMGLTQGPLRRMLQRAADGDAAVRESLGMKPDEYTQTQLMLNTNEGLLEQVIVEPVGDDARLIRYDVDRRAAILNQTHPFIGNYIDQRGAQEPLQLFGLTELLTQAYMLDENVDAEVVNRIMKRRDAFLRDLVRHHPRSAAVVARQLRDASNDEHLLEDAVADALEVLGFSVIRVGGNGKPDGIATVRLGRRGNGESKSYALTYDAKSSGKKAFELISTAGERDEKGRWKEPSTNPPRIQAGTMRTSILRVHRERSAKDFNLDVAPEHTLIVAPGFQGDGDKDALITAICSNDGITPITVGDLARLVELSPLRRLSPLSLRPLFDERSPDGARKFVETIEAQPAPQMPPVKQVIELLVQYSERKSAVKADTLSTAIYERTHGKLDLTHEDLTSIVRGLAALAPSSVFFDGEFIALNASPQSLLFELNQTLQDYPDRLANSYLEAVQLNDETVDGGQS
ncbi:hypothetical protein ABH935_004697 [Catenulispora sp. GAS73]|uniref:ATP-binding protein n=1 Tax=Catenulispora sp. GAS73 TaxID=3156269 RepID=UPI00351821B5